MKITPIKRGTYKVIRVDGAEELVESKPTIGEIERAIGATCLDTVILDFVNCVVMMVDDSGIQDGKPVNPKATELYLSRCKPGSTGTIHGDVALVHDKDFA